MSQPNAAASNPYIMRKLTQIFDETGINIRFDADENIYRIKWNDMVCTELKFVEASPLSPLETVPAPSPDAVPFYETIMVHQINRCYNDTANSVVMGSSKDIVQRLKKLADELKVSLTIENDFSRIEVPTDIMKLDDAPLTIYLRNMMLLHTGKTWYNMMGFKERNYEQNTTCATKFIKNTQFPNFSFHREKRLKIMKHRENLNLRLPTYGSSGSVEIVFSKLNYDLQKILSAWEKDLKERKTKNILQEEKDYVRFIKEQVDAWIERMEQDCKNKRTHVDLADKYGNLVYTPKEDKPASTPTPVNPSGAADSWSVVLRNPNVVGGFRTKVRRITQKRRIERRDHRKTQNKNRQ